MLGKKTGVNTEARIAMIFPAQDIELQETEAPKAEENSEEAVAEDKEKAQKVASQKTEPKALATNKIKADAKAQTKERKDNGKKTIAKTQPAQPTSKKKKAAKPQPKAQQPNAQKIEQPKKTEAVVKSEKTEKKPPRAENKTQKPAEQQVVDLTTQTEKPEGARYSIQIEAFGVQRNANRFLDKIIKKYPSAYIFENTKKKRLPLAVRIGYFVSYRKALEAAKVFQAREKRAAMVVKINQ